MFYTAPVALHNAIFLLLVANTKAKRPQRKQKTEKRKRRGQRGRRIRG